MKRVTYHNIPNILIQLIKIFAILIFALAIVNNFVTITTIWTKYFSQRLEQKYPLPIQPVARFTTSIDWKNRTINLDGSMSKTFNNNIDKYIWRIDDGTSLITTDNHLSHKFDYPGYYYIQMSIIDDNGQSDVADCTILMPTSNLKKILSTEYGYDQDKTQASYDWVPNETFFNYDKLLPSTQTYAGLTSPFVSSDCGLSTVSYNQEIATNNINNTLNNKRLFIKAIAKSIKPIISIMIFATLIILTEKLSKRYLIKPVTYKKK